MKFNKSNQHSGTSPEQKNTNNSITTHATNRLNNLRRKMSRGAANIFRMIKTRTHWGNKQLWGTREHGKQNLPLDKSSKQK